MSVPQINCGKQPEEPLSAGHLLPLPANSRFGNLQLKFLRSIERIDRVNVGIREVFQNFEPAHASDDFSSLRRHQLLQEEIIYWLRKTCDEMISMVAVLDTWKSTGACPERVDPDCIGRLAGSASIAPYASSHLPFLNALNDVSNAYKHSFVNSDVDLVGGDQPRVYALALKQNSTSNRRTFHVLTLTWIVEGFNGFCSSAIAQLKTYKASDFK